MRKVLITGTGVSDLSLEPLRAAGLEIAHRTQTLSDADLADELQHAVGFLVDGEEFIAASAMERATDLRVIAFVGVGYESYIDVDAADRHGIVVTNTPGALTDAVAEFTVGQLINANRRLTEYTNQFRAGRTGAEVKQHDLAARHVGIIGMGAIGSRIAEILRMGFGARVSYYSRSRRTPLEESLEITYLDRLTLASSCDVIIVMTPGNAATWNLVDEEFLRALPPASILVNTARPGIVESIALGRALRDGRVSVAAFDGFYGGIVGRSLLDEFRDDRLLVTGHIASLTHEARESMARKAVQSVLNVLAIGTDEYAVGSAGRR